MKKIIGIVVAATLILSSPFGLYLLWRSKVIELGEGLIARSVEKLIIRPLDAIQHPDTSPFIATGHNDPGGRSPVPCLADTGSTAIIVTFGQSNAGNVSATLRQGIEGFVNFNFLDGKCYRATDPLLGNSGDGGALWTVLGNSLVGAGKFKRVVLAPMAVGGTSINRWSDRNELGRRMDQMGEAMQVAALEPTHILWQQGAADHLPGPEYARRKSVV